MNFDEHQGTERYLNAATRGLWGRQRRALKAELRGHITARVQDFRLGGLSAAEAERQTLRELGAPVRVSGGMLGVYALPALGRAGALGALLMTGLLTVLPQGLAQVSGKFLAPDDALASSYLDFNQLKFEIAKVGGTLTGTAENPTISLPGLSIPTMLSGVAAWRGAALTQGGRQYIQGSAVLTRLRSTGAEVRLSGWNPVQIHVGNFVLTVETRGDRRVASDLYVESIGELFSDRVSSGRAIPRRTSFDNRGDRTNPNGLTFSGPVKMGEVYAIAVPIFST